MTDRELLDRSELTQEKLRKILNYNKSSGIFTWKVSNSNVSPIGTIAGRSPNSDGYAHVYIYGKFYKAHRLAWMYVYGEFPKEQIDHINGDRFDNRICNLRSVSNQHNTQNQRKPHKNNKSGALGVVKRKDGKYQAAIKLNGERQYLGTYPTVQEASDAYISAKKILHQGYVVAAEIGKAHASKEATDTDKLLGSCEEERMK